MQGGFLKDHRSADFPENLPGMSKHLLKEARRLTVPSSAKHDLSVNVAKNRPAIS
jgi:hypothetical protein